MAAKITDFMHVETMIAIKTEQFELNLTQFELVLNEDVLVSQGKVIPLDRIQSLEVVKQPSMSLQYSKNKRLLQTLFYLAMMACSVLIVLEKISAIWLGGVLLVFLGFAYWQSRRELLPTLVLHLNSGVTLSLLQTPNQLLISEVSDKIKLAMQYSQQKTTALNTDSEESL